jgi:hypothetical protein
MKKWLMSFLLPFMGIFATDHMVNVDVSAIHPRVMELSSLELDYRIVNTFVETSIIVNPRFKPLGNGNLFSGLGIGARTLKRYGMFGYHLACDHSYVHKSHHLQLVPSFEYFGSMWNYNLNAYLPVKNFQEDQIIGLLIQTHRYLDHEVVYKWQYANLSFSHNFNIETMKHGYVGKVSKDLGPVNVSFSGGLDGHHGKHVQLSLSYNIFNGSSRDELARVNRRVGAVYDCKVLQIPKPKQRQSTVTVKIIDKATQAQIDEIHRLIEQGNIPPPPAPPVVEKHWYDFFVKGRSD